MPERDCIRRFIFEDLGVRGEWVNLKQSWQEAKHHHHYPLSVQQQLGHAVAAVSLLSATIKFDGALILQAQGDGQLKAVVAQCSHNQQIRGWAKCQQSELSSGTLEEMFGHGQLILTIKSKEAEPYQGIVALQGNDLSVALQNYFTHSEQLKTRLWLYADAEQAAGLLLQELPTQQGYQADWERLEILANTVTERELLSLSCEDMLNRLFNEEKVRLFQPQPVVFSCNCSLEKITSTLNSLGRNTLEEILQEQGEIKVDCEFCSQQYRFDKQAVENLLRQQGSNMSMSLH